MEVVERRGAWARIVCSNGWGAWVDGRRLVPAGVTPGPSATPGTSMQRGAIIALAGAGAAMLSAVLPWVSVPGLGTGSAFKVSVNILFSPNSSSGGVRLGLVVLLFAGAAAASLLVPKMAGYRKPAAGVLGVIAVVYIVQVERGLPAGHFWNFVGWGTYLCLAAAVAILSGGDSRVSLPSMRPAAAPQAGAFQPQPAASGWMPTHRAPAAGLQTWPAADAAATPGPRIGGGLDVRLLERQGDWAHVECSNGWRTWVDGRLLDGGGT